MKRKFSFDIPKLKLGGPSKADSRTLRDYLSPSSNAHSALDSPPPTPKSVRPPLSPRADAELRSACAYILQNFKPSHIVYQETYGGPAITSSTNGNKPQLDYSAIKQSASRPEAPTSTSDTHVCGPELDNSSEESSRSRGKHMHRPVIAAEDVLKSEEVPKPRIPHNAVLRADQLMGPPPSKSASSNRSGVHTRNVSNPQVPAVAKVELVERPKMARRNDSIDTVDSTPHTESTDYPWSERASTATTSAMVTPARGSKRTSSQAMPSGSESGSAPKIDIVDADWMRQELEKHRKAQEERLQAEKDKQDGDGVGVAVTSPTPAIAKIARKPVPPSRSTSRQETEAPQHIDSREGYDHHRSRQVTKETASVVDRQPRATIRSDSKQPRALSRASSRARSITRDVRREVKEYFRPSSRQQDRESNEMQRAPSRARSMSRQVKEFIRPGTAAASRKPSVDLSRTASRARSVDSEKSSVSETGQSTASSSNQWRPWNGLRHRRGSASSQENDRPGSSGSTSRGRNQARDTPQAPKPKPKVNLNRELPPLPSLDQWKAEQAETPASRHNKGSCDSGASSRLLREGVAAPSRSLKSPTETTLSTSSRPTGKRAVAPAQTYTPPPPSRPSMDTISSSPEPREHHRIGPTTSIDPPATWIKSGEGQRSRRAKPPLSHKEPAALTYNSRRSMERPVYSGKAQLVNYSRTAGAPINIGRAVSQRNHLGVSSGSNISDRHSRVNSDRTNFSRRKASVDDGVDEYSRMYKDGLQNMVEISSTSSKSPPPHALAKDKSKRKWWQPKEKRHEDWMDSVVRSGSHGGLILTDEVATAPIVRY